MSGSSVSNLGGLQIIPSTDLIIAKPIAKGDYSNIYVGMWNGREVAIKKVIHENFPLPTDKDFVQEAAMMSECGKSAQIIKFFSVCTEANNCSIVMEYMALGTLKDVLSNQEIPLPWLPVRLQIAIDIGKGLSYLHEKEILHLNLKSHHVLLDQNLNAKITNVGLSTLMLIWNSNNKQDEPIKKSTGTNWQASDLFKTNLGHTKATDIRDYVRILREIGFRRSPDGDVTEFESKEEKSIPPEWPSGYGELIQQVLGNNDEKLLSAHDIVTELDKLFLLQLAHSLKSTPESPPTVLLISEPTIGILQHLVFQLINNEEIKNYPLLLAHLKTYIVVLLNIPKNQSLESVNPQIYQLVQQIMTSKHHINFFFVGPLEEAVSLFISTSHLASKKSVVSFVPLVTSLKSSSVPAVPEMAFGKVKWEKHFGDVGIEPLLPSNIEEILDTPSPIWVGKKIRDTHILVLIPKTVNGEPFNLKKLEQLAKTPKQGPAMDLYDWFWLGDYTDPPSFESHWALFSRDIIPASRGKKYVEQEAQVANLARQTGIPYQVPNALDATTAIYLEFIQSGTRLYGDSPIPWTYTNLGDKYNTEVQLITGGFWSSHLSVAHSDYLPDDWIGMAILWKL